VDTGAARLLGHRNEEMVAANERLDQAGPTIAVGAALTGRPPHRSGRAVLRHPALTLGMAGHEPS
jgi:hypothetical protein